MFGMLSAYKPELKIRDFECYQAVYCGLCKEIAKSSGAFARLNLSYDLVFLAMLGMAAEEKQLTKQGRCMLNPFRKKRYCIDSRALNYTAHVGVLLTYSQLQDTIRDEKGWKRLAARFALIPYAFMRKKTKKLLPQLALMIDNKINLLSLAEIQGKLTLDGFADLFASLLSQVFAGIVAGETEKRIYSEIGYFIGKWIYLMDAYEDIEEDFKQKKFNPLFGFLSFENQSSINFTEQMESRMKIVITDIMARLASAYELINPGRYKPILDNIIYFSMELKFQSIAKKGACK